MVYFAARAVKISSSDIDRFLDSTFRYYRETGKFVFLAIDEAQSCEDMNIWLSILKENIYLVPIVTGLPMHFESPQFNVKEEPSFLFFSEDEVESELLPLCKDYLTSQYLEVENSEGLLLEAIDKVRQFTSGQAFPLLSLCHYLCSEHPQLVVKGEEAVDAHFRNQSFMNSNIIKDRIIPRCYAFSIQFGSALKTFFENPSNLSDSSRFLLVKSGLINEARDVSSNLFVQVALASTDIFLKTETANTIDEVIIHSIRQFSLDKFMEPDGSTNAYENAIGFYFGAHITKLKDIFVKPEVQIYKPGKKYRGHLPCVDFYIDGRFDMCIELVRNGDKLNEHVERFELPTGAYYHFRNNYVIVNFQIIDEGPVLSNLLEKYEKISNNIFTYMVSERALYRGRNKIFQNLEEGKTVSHPILGSVMQTYANPNRKEK